MRTSDSGRWARAVQARALAWAPASWWSTRPGAVAWPIALALALALVLALGLPARAVAQAPSADAASAPTAPQAPQAPKSPEAATPVPAEGPPPLVYTFCDEVPGVAVRDASPAEARDICAGVARAVHFLAPVGLRPPTQIVVAVVDLMPGDLAHRAVGCYVSESRRILLLRYPAFVASGPWFRMTPDPEMYRAAAAHEMAHALVACNARPGAPTLGLGVHEYVAYVTLFATLDPAHRQRILTHFPGTGLRNALQINGLVHLLDPLGYAVDAWRHYLRQHDRVRWLQALLTGEVVREVDGDGP